MRIQPALGAIALTLVTLQARAASVRVAFAGHVSELLASSDVADPVGALGGSIQPGTTFSGFFTFDNAAAPVIDEPEDDTLVSPGTATYRYRVPDWTQHTEIGSYSTDARGDIPFLPGAGLPLLPGGYDIVVDDWTSTSFGADSVIAQAQVGPVPGAGSPLELVYVRVLLTGGAAAEPLHSTKLAPIPWALSAFPEQDVSWRFLDGSGAEVEVEGVLDSLDSVSTSVPDPAPVALIVAMIAMLAAFESAGFRLATPASRPESPMREAVDQADSIRL